MKNNSVVIFPDTVPAERMLIPLVQVFQPVVYLQAVENDQPPEPRTALLEELISRGLCHLTAPSPLGEDRERFVRLVSDIRSRRDDYAAQLSHLSLASMSNPGRHGSETKSSIISGLLGSHGIRDSGREERTAILWQARLVLKLAEFMDADRQELEHGMQAIASREQGLFAGLGREDGFPYRLTEQLRDLAGERDDSRSLRLKAWARIFSLGDNAPAAGSFVTGDHDAFEQLMDVYRQEKGLLAGRICRIRLPARWPDHPGSLAVRQQFQQEGAGLLDSLAALLNEPRPAGQAEEWFDPEGGWEALLEKHYPAAACGRSILSLHLFAGISAPALFTQSFGDLEGMAQETDYPGSNNDVIIGLLESAG